MEDGAVCPRKFSRTNNIRSILISGMMASLIVMFHSFTFPSRRSLLPILPASESIISQQAVSRLSLLIDSMNAPIADKSLVSDEISEQDDVDDGDEVNDHNHSMDDDGGDEGSLSDRNAVKDVLDSFVLSKVNSSLNASLDVSPRLSGTSSIVEVKNETILQSVPVMKKRSVPIKSIEEMMNIMIRNYAAYHSMRPHWNSPRDRELLSIKAQIDNAPISRQDDLLHAPAFRNISRFKRSYQLMERTLKVYVYSDGKKPVFHQPITKGIYASEGWFMKLMEGNRRYVVRDPRRAHLFYMPFSSRHLQFATYVRGSHNRTTLRVFLQKYVDLISSKYPFWNRTDGSDHFLVACHDWAAYATRHVMAKSFKALCNADLAGGFKLGRDVSLPETYVRSARDPQRDLGGQSIDQRQTLAFYAGNLHGYLRPILLHYWENRDPDMKIMGPMPPGVQSKMTYIGHMKNSKFCICPRGYEVNSPRIVESMFYECVPVIISDNYVPPFFEVLDWSTFSVFVPEKDIPNLKEILLGISEEKYRSLQLGVRRVQQHFLWHATPVKYDLFHMTLHSIWYNRVMNARPK